MDLEDSDTREFLKAIGRSQDGGENVLLKYIDAGRNVVSSGSALNEMIVSFAENAAEPLDVLNDMQYVFRELKSAIAALSQLVI